MSNLRPSSRARETIEQKTVRYLAEGRVTVKAVTPAGVEAQVQGSSPAPYTTRLQGGRWSCSCPAWRNRCTHITAVRLVTSDPEQKQR